MPDPTQSVHTLPEQSDPASEADLVVRARNGDRAAFRSLVERHMRGAYDVAYRFTKDHEAAEDLAQEAFVRVYASLDSFRGDAGFRTWLYRIVVNLSLNRVKELQRRRKHEVRSLSGSVAVSDDLAHAAQRTNVSAHLERALHELPTMQRAVLILRHVDGLTTKQVSRILRCSEGTVKTHLFRGLEKLRHRLEFLKDE